MRGPTSPPARAALAAYADEARGDRFHTLVRWWSAPFPAIEREVPLVGRVLEVGCGHGLLTTYLALAAPTRELAGVDIDAHKVEIARRAATRLPPGTRPPVFSVVEPGEVVPGPWDAVVIADVLYLLDPAKRAALLAAYAAELAPEGRLVVKEVDDRPRWKFAVMAAQEKLSTGVLGITAGEDLSFPSLVELAAVLADVGLDVRTRRLDRGYPWPHVLAVGTRTRARRA